MDRIERSRVIAAPIDKVEQALRGTHFWNRGAADHEYQLVWLDPLDPSQMVNVRAALQPVTSGTRITVSIEGEGPSVAQQAVLHFEFVDGLVNRIAKQSIDRGLGAVLV
jgi:subtilase family serine protease